MCAGVQTEFKTLWSQTGRDTDKIRFPTRTFCKTGLQINFQAVSKSAGSAASPIAWGEPRSRRPPAEAVVLALPKQSGRLR